MKFFVFISLIFAGNMMALTLSRLNDAHSVAEQMKSPSDFLSVKSNKGFSQISSKYRDLFDPTVKQKPKAADEELQNWGVTKYTISEHSTVDELVEGQKEGHYIDPNDLHDWFKSGDSSRRLEVYKNEGLFLALMKANDYDPLAHDNEAIKFLSENGQTQAVKLLLNDGKVDPSAGNNYAIQMASTNGHADVVKLLLPKNGVDPSVNNNYAIKMASGLGHTSVVETLLKDGRVDPAADKNAPLVWATKHGYINVIKVLATSKKVDLNQALYQASFAGQTQVVKFILTYSRLRPSALNNYAIKVATQSRRSEVVKLLLADRRVKLSDSEIANLKHQWRDDQEIVGLFDKKASRGISGFFKSLVKNANSNA